MVLVHLFIRPVDVTIVNHKIRIHQENSIKHNAVEGLSHWKNFANELSTLKKDLKDSKGELNYYKDVVFNEFKDAANTTGNFGTRITALESAVKKILEKFN